MNRRDQKHHQIKCWPDYFTPTQNGDKPFEVREDDRNYRVGDLLIIREWNPETEEFTDRVAIRKITYKLQGGQLGIKDSYCVLGIKTIEEAKADEN